MQLQVGQAIWVRVVANWKQGPVAEGDIMAAAADRITIGFPDLSAAPADCVTGCSVALRVLSEQGTHVAEAVVMRVQSSPRVIITVRAPESFTLVPHRKFFRVATKLPVVCTITASSYADTVGSVDPTAMTQNISAGGMGLLTGLALHFGDEVALSVSIQGLRAVRTTLELAGQVLRVGPAASKPRVTFSAGIQFAHRGPQQEDALVRLMFDLQRKSLK